MGESAAVEGKGDTFPAATRRTRLPSTRATCLEARPIPPFFRGGETMLLHRQRMQNTEERMQGLRWNMVDLPRQAKGADPCTPSQTSTETLV